MKIEAIGKTFSRVTLTFDFMESHNVAHALAIARKHGWQFDIVSTSFFLLRRLLKPAVRSAMPRWQHRLFIALTHISNDATSYFQIPTSGRDRHASDDLAFPPARRASALRRERAC